MQQNQRFIPDLRLDTNPSFEIVEDEGFDVDVGDLSQLGLERGKLPAALQLPIVQGARIDLNGCAKSAIIKTLFQVPRDIPEDAVIRLSVDTTLLQQAAIGDSREGSIRAIAELQNALDPTNAYTMKDIVQNPSMVDATQAIIERGHLARANVAARINAQLVDNEELLAFLVSQDIIQSDQRTAAAESAISEEELRAMSYGQFLAVQAKMRDVDEMLRKNLQVIDFLKLLEAAPEEESTFLHPLMSATFQKIRQEVSVRSFQCPESISRVVTRKDFGRLVAVQAETGPADAIVKIPIVDGKQHLVGEFALYILSLRQVAPANVERAREFAFARQIIVRHGLFIGSDEKKNMVLRAPLTIDALEVREWALRVKKPEASYACLFATAHSFLISGHHATAANMDNKLAKILGAIGQPVSLEQARSMLSTAVYNGPHVASMILLIAYLLNRANKEKVSNAIALRLRPNPPLSAAYVNLEIFADALNAARFFEVLGRQDEYNSFKENMKEIRRTMWYVAPYSMYLYGKSAPDPSYHKTEAAKLASYASALRTALPNSTLLMSPALEKLAEESNRNAISSALYVEAYVVAFRRLFRVSIEQQMAKSFGIGRAALQQ